MIECLHGVIKKGYRYMFSGMQKKITPYFECCRGEPMCSPLYRADTQVCPYRPELKTGFLFFFKKVPENKGGYLLKLPLPIHITTGCAVGSFSPAVNNSNDFRFSAVLIIGSCIGWLRSNLVLVTLIRINPGFGLS